MEPDFLELSRVSCVVYMTMGVYYNYGFVGNPLHRTAEIADAHPGINQHGFLCTNEKKQTCYIKFINFPGILSDLYNGIKLGQRIIMLKKADR